MPSSKTPRKTSVKTHLLAAHSFPLEALIQASASHSAFIAIPLLGHFLLPIPNGIIHFPSSNLSGANTSGASQIVGFLWIEYAFTRRMVPGGTREPTTKHLPEDSCGSSRGAAGEKIRRRAMEVVALAHGKVLITGGYLILERPNAGIVFTTTPCFYAIVKPLDSINPFVKQAVQYAIAAFKVLILQSWEAMISILAEIRCKLEPVVVWNTTALAVLLTVWLKDLSLLSYLSDKVPVSALSHTVEDTSVYGTQSFYIKTCNLGINMPVSFSIRDDRPRHRNRVEVDPGLFSFGFLQDPGSSILQNGLSRRVLLSIGFAAASDSDSASASVAALVGGVNRVEEDEENIDPALGRACAADHALFSGTAVLNTSGGRVAEDPLASDVVFLHVTAAVVAILISFRLFAIVILSFLCALVIVLTTQLVGDIPCVVPLPGVLQPPASQVPTHGWNPTPADFLCVSKPNSTLYIRISAPN
ncbi:hypothetical protein ZIOFF_026517 [Zingiber officinale]|uniref:Uncharacterized protein n=1 Tax=Zingiber officinale TaxID=94328 RepID=A0A8J5HEG0_ZINOF|nr:hypothetical protein ZIOFF_026517 [Zingiber officinale]